MLPPWITDANLKIPGHIRAVILDLDGTCMDETLFIHPRVIDAITHAAQKLPVILATGRMYRSALIWAQKFGITQPLVCYQGALIRALPSAGNPGATLQQVMLGAGAAMTAIDIARRHGWHRQAYVNDVLYCEEQRPEADLYAAIAQVPITYVADLQPVVEGGSTKITCVDQDPMVVAECRRTMRDELGAAARVMTSLPQFCEIVDPRVSKAAAVTTVLASARLSLSAAVAVGDGGNDVDLLRQAGIGVAVDGGSPEALAAAAARCRGPRDGGVADVLHRILGGG